MPTIRPVFKNGEKYHIISRSIDERCIFKETQDYQRFARNLYWFNDRETTSQAYSRFYATDNACKEILLRAKYDREILVKIISVCLMPNHIHLLLEQVTNDGISQFMKKLAGGYACYFNNKYKRCGHVFQGRFKVQHIQTLDKLLNTACYIHTHLAISMIRKQKNYKKIDQKKIIQVIEYYKWSSYKDCVGDRDFPYLLYLYPLWEIMAQDKWREVTYKWIKTNINLIIKKTNNNIMFE